MSVGSTPPGNCFPPLEPGIGGPGMPIERAMPKSMSKALPCRSTMMLAGFRSRWTMPSACAATSPESDCLAIDSVRASGMRPSSPKNGREILAFDVRHRDVLDAVDLSEVVNSDDVLVRDLPGEEQLALESPLQVLGGGLIVCNLRPNHLQRDRDAKLGVPRLVDGAHAAEAKQSGNAVTGAELRPDREWPSRTVARRPRSGTESRGIATQLSGIAAQASGTGARWGAAPPRRVDVGVRRRDAGPEASGVSILARSVRNQTGRIGRVNSWTQELRRVVAD